MDVLSLPRQGWLFPWLVRLCVLTNRPEVMRGYYPKPIRSSYRLVAKTSCQGCDSPGSSSKVYICPSMISSHTTSFSFADGFHKNCKGDKLRQTDGLTPAKQTHIETHRHTDTQTHRHTDTQTHRHKHTQTNRTCRTR